MAKKTEKDIFASAKALISHHHMTSKACMQHICSCSQPFPTQVHIDRHIVATNRTAGADHFQLSYCSIISRDNHMILNVEPLEPNQIIRNFAAFRGSTEIVYGSNIGRNNTTINPLIHSRAKFTRAGSTVKIVPSVRPKKKPKQFSDSVPGESPYCSDEEMINGSDNFSSSEIEYNNHLSRVTSNSNSRSILGSSSANNVRLMSTDIIEPKLVGNILLDIDSSM